MVATAHGAVGAEVARVERLIEFPLEGLEGVNYGVGIKI